MQATTAPTDFTLWRVSWYVSYPMIMEADIGILTDQGSPPSLQFVWTATLVATLSRLLGLVRTVAVMH